MHVSLLSHTPNLVILTDPHLFPLDRVGPVYNSIQYNRVGSKYLNFYATFVKSRVRLPAVILCYHIM